MTLEFSDIIELIENKIGKEQWVYLYKKESSLTENFYIYSAIIPNEHVIKVLGTDNWDVTIGGGRPGYSSMAPDFETEYLRFGNFDNIEPLVYIRKFRGMVEDSIEISQEFIHYFNLYFDQCKNKYIEILQDGSTIEAIVMEEDSIKVRLKHLKVFLAVKKSHLAIYFDIWRISDKTLSQLNIKKGLKNSRKDNYIYSLEFFDRNRFMHVYPDGKSCSCFLGKILIEGKKNFIPDQIFGGSEKEEYLEFIVGINENGEERSETCNPHELGPNEFLTPVFFKRDVLKKYYDNPQKYEVVDSYVMCRSLWSMPIDNNLRDSVAVFLGDLGRHLSYNEQMYWKGFNIMPEGGISQTYWNRSMMNIISPPEMYDLLFKQYFEEFNRFWCEKFEWYLFKPLNEPDQYVLSTLHVPLSESPAEFEQQVIFLTKIIVDSINQAELKKRIGEINNEMKGIDRLNAYLEEQQITRHDTYIKFLRNLQTLRSKGVAHRKSKDYEKEIKKLNFLDFEKKGYVDNFIDILSYSIRLLKFLIFNFKNN